MKLTDEYEMSEWAYYQCVKNDTIQMRRLITNSEWAYYYCKDVKDREEIWKKINTQSIAEMYCRNVKDRPEVRRYIKR